MVTRVLRSGQLSLGPCLAEFEERFAAYAGSSYAIAVNSGTSALHLCVRALGIGPGDEVLTTSFSFVASANCILYEGAVPAFADIDSATLNIDPSKISEAITRDYVWKKGRLINRASGRVLRAILPVHVFGMPCDMEAISQIAATFGLHVIEDACEALGARHAGRAAGTSGDFGVFAFYPNKQMTTAEGGMIVTNDERLALVCRSLRNQGRDESTAWLRHERLGYNYRLSELHCALGLAQLGQINGLLTAREQVAARYTQMLSGIPQIGLPCERAGRKRSWFVYVIRLLGSSASELRAELIEGLRIRGIACQTYFPAIHLQPYFRDVPLSPVRLLPETESASDSCLALPFFPSMSSEETEEVCAVVREIIQSSANPRRRVARADREPPSTPKHTQESEQTFVLR